MADLKKGEVKENILEPKYTTIHVAGGLIVGLLLGGGITYFVGYTAQGTSLKIADVVSSTTDSASASSSEQLNDSFSILANENNVLKVSDQNAGYSVIIENAKVESTDWIAVLESRNGAPGNVLGAARFAEESSMGVIELLRKTAPGETYFVSIYMDDGNGSFSKNDDALMKGQDGKAQFVTFVAK